MESDNELYDSACDVLAAAQRLHRASRGDGLGDAIPATLGCIESALEALTVATAALQHHADDARAAELEALAQALRHAEHQAAEARRARRRLPAAH